MKSAGKNAKKTVSNKKNLSTAPKNTSKKKTGSKAKTKKKTSVKAAEKKSASAEIPASASDIFEENQEPGGTEYMSQNDTMKSYMREIDQYALVSKEQEVDLAAKIHGHDHAERESARETLIKANLRLVVKIAHDFKGWGIQLLDLISEGNIGLMRAVVKFDPAKGAKFSSYAAWWIRQSMRRALANQSRVIRIPVQTASKISKLRSMRIILKEKLGREPSDGEIAQALGYSERTAAVLRQAELQTISLYDPIRQGEDGEFQDIIPDKGAPTPDRILGDRESIRHVADLMDLLDERERLILKLRFGLDGHRPRTLEEVCQLIGRTRERVRQIQNQALKKLHDLLKDEVECIS